MSLALVSASGALLAALMLGILGARLAGVPVHWASIGVSATAGAVITGIAWLTGWTGIPAVYAAPVIALGAFFAVAITLRHREVGGGLIRTGIFAAILTALVFAPCVTLVFAPWYDPFATGIGYVDLGAALPTTVAAGAIVLAVGFVERRSPQLRPSTVGAWSTLWPALVMWAGWILWLCGLELAIDRTVPLILGDAVLMPLAAGVAFSVVERVRHRRNTVRGVALGLVAGCAAATPSAGYLIPALAVLTALIVGAVAALVPFDDLRSASRSLGGSLLIGGGVSILLLGFLATDMSFIYTGQPELSYGQVLSIIIGGVGGFVLGAAAWAVIRLGRG